MSVSSREVASLEASASDLSRRIQRARQDALRERRQGQKRAALVHLGRMKQFQAARDKRLSSLYTLETALDQVQSASGGVSIVHSVPTTVRSRSLSSVVLKKRWCLSVKVGETNSPS